MEVGAFHAAGGEDAVDVGELLDGEVGVFGEAALEAGVLVLGEVGEPALAVGVPAEVAADDDADVVEFEALGGVDAANFVEAAGLVGPEGVGVDAGLGCGLFAFAEHFGRLAVPGHGPGADLDVGHQGVVGVGVGPGPAEAGDEAGAVGLGGAGADGGFEVGDVVEDADFVFGVALPGVGGCVAEAEGVFDPADVGFTAGTTELGVEVVEGHGDGLGRGVVGEAPD